MTRPTGLLVAAVTVAVFLPALRNGFVNWDDVANFLQNAHYRGLRWANLRWMFTTLHMGHYIPVTWLTLSLDYLLWGVNPLGYHLTSIVLHAVNAGLFYLLALRLLRLALPEAGGAALLLGAATAALLFSVNPLRVESVAWITERRDLVCGLFSLLTALAYVAACRRGTAARLHRGWYWFAVGLFALALLSKSIVVGLPVVLLALDHYPLGRASGSMARVWRLFAEKIPFLLLSVAVSLVMVVSGQKKAVLTSLETLGVPERLAISGYGLAFYLWKTVLPWPLSPFYELHYPVRLLAAMYWGPAMAVLAISAVAVMARRRWPAGLTAWIVYVILLLPVIGLFHNGYQIAADRYSYLACLGSALLAGGGIARCWDAKQRGRIAPRLAALVLALAAVVIAGQAGLTTLQIRVWRDSETLWAHAITADPKSAFSHFHLGVVLSGSGARAEFERALALLPDRLPIARAVFHARLGQLLQQQGDLAGAEENYRAALRYSEDNVIAHYNLGDIQAQRGELRSALDSFVRVLRLLPGDPDTCLSAQRVATSLAVSPREFAGCPPGTPSGTKRTRRRETPSPGVPG